MKNKLITIFVVISSIVNAQYTLLHSFNDTDGVSPYHCSLMLSNGLLYGTTYNGGTHNSGIIFSIDTNGNGYTVLLNFNDTNGQAPCGSLTSSGNRLYGMTLEGGIVDGGGNIFSIDVNGGGYKNLWDFNFTNGSWPYGSLVLVGKALYGMVATGGANDKGVIFSIDTDGSRYRVLLNFNGTNGQEPGGSLISLGKLLYGMSPSGGSLDFGCVFSIDTNGTNYKDLFNFNDTNGKYPYGDLTMSGGKLYGMTYAGGVKNDGCTFSIDTNGNNYKKLLDFDDTNGKNPYNDLFLSGNKLYGMTYAGGVIGDGCIFSIDTDGSSYKKMLDFDGTNGNEPLGGLTISHSIIYGMTERGGAYSDGVIFKIDTNAISFASINNLEINKGIINAYPNPSNGEFTLSWHSEQSEESLPIIEIYNVVGEKVLTGTLRYAQGENLIDISNQPNGVYFYQVLNDSGNFIASGKIIVTH